MTSAFLNISSSRFHVLLLDKDYFLNILVFSFTFLSFNFPLFLLPHFHSFFPFLFRAAFLLRDGVCFLSTQASFLYRYAVMYFCVITIWGN